MSQLIGAIEQEVAQERAALARSPGRSDVRRMVVGGEVPLQAIGSYPDYSDWGDYSDTGWADNWSDGPHHTDTWSDQGWPVRVG